MKGRAKVKRREKGKEEKKERKKERKKRKKEEKKEKRRRREGLAGSGWRSRRKGKRHGLGPGEEGVEFGLVC